MKISKLKILAMILISCFFIACNQENKEKDGCKYLDSTGAVYGKFGCYPDTIVKYNMQKIYDSCLWEVYKRFYNHSFYCRMDWYKLKSSEVTHSFQYLYVVGSTGYNFGDTIAINFTFFLNDSLACYSSIQEFENMSPSYSPSFFCRKSMPDSIFGLYFEDRHQLFHTYDGYFNFRVRSNTFKNHYDYILYNFEQYELNRTKGEKTYNYLKSDVARDSIYQLWYSKKLKEDSLYKIQQKNFYEYLKDNKDNLPEHLRKEAIRRKVIRE
jgi:hypothetical protein